MVQSSGEIIAITVVLTTVAMLAVLLRSWARIITKQRHEVDDYLAYAAVFFLITLISIPLIVACARGNNGNHSKISPDGSMEPPSYLSNLCLYLLETCCWISLSLSKCSVVLLYRRLFRRTIYEWIVWTVVGVTIAWAITFFFLSVFQCTPIKLSLENSMNIKCIQPDYIFVTGSVTDVVLDLAILAIPGPIIAKLHLQLKTKVAVTCVFLLGALTLAASATRMAEFIHASKLVAEGDEDASWFIAPTTYWTAIEAALSVVAVCLPCLMPFFREDTRRIALHNISSVFSLGSDRSSRSSHREGGVDAAERQIKTTTIIRIDSDR